MRSPAGVPPGSRTSTASRPVAASAARSRSACTVFPLPSGPSSVMKTPRRGARRCHGARVARRPGPRGPPAPVASPRSTGQSARTPRVGRYAASRCTRSPTGRWTPPGFGGRPTPMSASSAGWRSRSTSRAVGSTGVSIRETEGFGVRVLVDGAWGFASSPRPDRRARRTGSRRRPSGSPGRRATALRRPGRARRSPAGPSAGSRRRSPRTRSRSPWRRRSATCSPRTRPRRVAGIAFTESTLRRPARMEDVRGHGRQLHRAGDHPRRGRPSRRTRSTATSTSGAATRTPGAAGRRAGYEYVRGLDLAGAAERSRGGGRAADRAPAAAGPADDRAGPVAALPPDPRELRPPDGAGPRLRDGGQLRRAQAS